MVEHDAKKDVEDFSSVASLNSHEVMGRRPGSFLVGCSLSDTSAFFVRGDLVGEQLAEPFTAENHFEPPRYWLQWRKGHPANLHDNAGSVGGPPHSARRGGSENR